MSDIWFGTREHMQWVPAWASGPKYGREGSIESATYLNGGAGGRFGRTSHRTYDLIWNAKSRDRIRDITDYADGVYGDGLIYWADPLWMSTNALPQRWSTPWLTARDAPPLLRDARPQRVSTPAGSQRYPVYGARYTKRAASVSDSIFIPIPPGFEAWVGVHGEGNAADVVSVRRWERTSPSGALVKPEVLGVNTTTRVNAVVEGGQQAWAEVFLDLDVLDVGDSFDLYGLVVQVLPSPAVPGTGGFISGQGHSGCEFVKLPTDTVISAHEDVDRVTTTASLTETGSWL